MAQFYTKSKNPWIAKIPVNIDEELTFTEVEHFLRCNIDSYYLTLAEHLKKHSWIAITVSYECNNISRSGVGTYVKNNIVQLITNTAVDPLPDQQWNVDTLNFIYNNLYKISNFKMCIYLRPVESPQEL